MIEIEVFAFNAFSENTYVLYDETKEAIIVDPGCYETSEQQELVAFLEAEELTPKKVVLTHSHIDHVLGVNFCCTQFGIPLCIYEKDAATLKMNEVVAAHWGFPAYQAKEPDEFMPLDQPLTFGKSSLELRFTPGHAPGHVVLYSKEHNFVIGGDVLFRESIGRTDLPGGDFQTLIDSINNELFTLPDEVAVHPGHGPSTTIGHEKVYNPFCGQSA